MGNATSAAVPVLCAATAMSALELVHLLDPQPGAGTTAAAQAQALRDAVRAFLPVVAAGGLSTSVALTYRHIHHAAGAAAGAGAGNRRLPGPVAFVLCASAALLQLLLFTDTVQAPGTVDHGAAARALGLAALPAAATVTYYLGILLIIVGHIRAGGEGGGTAVAGNGPIEAPVGLLVKMAIGAAAGLVWLMAMAAL